MTTPGERGAVRLSTALAAVAAGVLVLAGLGWAWAASSGQSEEDELVAVVDQFRAPQTWEVLVDDLEPARLLCLGGNACPSARKDWSVPDPLGPQDLQALIDQAGWDMQVEGDCQPKTNTSSVVGVCDAHGVVDGMGVSVIQNLGADQPGAQVQLFAQPEATS